ncbi:hypothetical protein [Hymenobacter swuensis]|uniref:Uncharacterized protein n=1 Tax=Hymenobacter swuensis DY53 TaxID=1227739 RepID=W8FCE5_9BACT|nr:hypothetical protein [Hymenobacter swuensis]AHJ99360.1 hypothetical protein Hsw_3765 [Hymenobacter swuensis DY53]
MTTPATNQPADEWDSILNHLRQIREQVQQNGPLPEQERAEVEDAFRQGLAHLENEVQGIRTTLKGSSGKW